MLAREARRLERVAVRRRPDRLTMLPRSKRPVSNAAWRRNESAANRGEGRDGRRSERARGAHRASRSRSARQRRPRTSSLACAGTPPVRCADRRASRFVAQPPQRGGERSRVPQRDKERALAVESSSRVAGVSAVTSGDPQASAWNALLESRAPPSRRCRRCRARTPPRVLAGAAVRDRRDPLDVCWRSATSVLELADPTTRRRRSGAGGRPRGSSGGRAAGSAYRRKAPVRRLPPRREDSLLGADQADGELARRPGQLAAGSPRAPRCPRRRGRRREGARSSAASARGRGAAAEAPRSPTSVSARARRAR